MSDSDYLWLQAKRSIRRRTVSRSPAHATRDRRRRSRFVALPLLAGAHTLFFARSQKCRNVGLGSAVRRLTDILAMTRDERQ